MIRIDLGKSDPGKGRGGGLQKLLSGLNLKLGGKNIKLPKFGGGGGRGGGGLGKITGDAKSLIVIGITFAIACLPHLFFTQFRAYVIQEHQARMAKLQESITVLDQEVEKLKPFQKELESYEQQKRIVKERLETVRELLSNRGTPVAVLDAIGQSLPQKAWLTNIEFGGTAGAAPGQGGGGGEGGVKMQGESYTNEDISDFLDKLSESVHLTDVRLEDVTTGKMDTIDVRVFRVNATPKMRLGTRKTAATRAPGAAAGQAPPATAPAAVPNPGGTP